MICRNCGEEIGWRVLAHEDGQSQAFVHIKTGRDLCHRATFAEPEQKEDVILARVIELAGSGFMAQPQTITALVFAISDLAKMAVRLAEAEAEAEASRPSCPPQPELLAAQKKIKELEQWCRDFGANQMIAAADAVR